MGDWIPHANFGGAVMTVDFWRAVKLETASVNDHETEAKCSSQHIGACNSDINANPTVAGVIDPVDAVKLRNNVGLEVRRISLRDGPRVASSADEDKAPLLIDANFTQMNVLLC